MKMDSYRASAIEGLRALVACCFTAAPANAPASDDAYMTQREQQQNGLTRRLPWFLSTVENSASSESETSAVAMGSSADDVLATSSTAIGAASQPPPRWLKDDHTTACTQCASSFDLLTRRHHCRACGLVFCTSCTAQRERVVQFGFTEPVRVCLACAIDARAHNDFYAKHLPLLEKGAEFTKHGLLLKRPVLFSFLRTKLLFQYQTLDAETRQPIPNDIKAFPLDSINDVQQVPIDRENGMLGLLILVGPKNEAHRLDAATPEQKQQWLAASESVRALRSKLVAREKDRRAKQAAAQHAEMARASASLKKIEERKASFHQERMAKRAEQRELLRAKYKLGASSSSMNVSAPTAAV
jgi:hypothetical protein